ncbi:MAG: WD40/YVTN/BNR-like repeat-containing protein [Chthoniobacterales bacterium]
MWFLPRAGLVLLLVSQITGVSAQSERDFGQLLRWRNIGPYRGGRTRAISGVPSQPNLFYMAQVNGGVFKTTDFGRTWQPIFDDQPTGSIGALAVSISNPEVIYVGSGEGLHRPDLSVGDGIYKSVDAGKTWTHLGLRDGQQIAQIALDPHNPDRLFVAVAGHPYGPNEERGIFRSLDGGKNFEKVLYKDENTGGGDVQIDPANSEIVYASLWEAREGPWENSNWSGNNGGIFKSSDGGKTWKQLRNGLPDVVVQANLAIAASAPNKLFAAVAMPKGSKLFRSDDAGESWTLATDDPRPGAGIGGGDLPVVRIDPTDPKVIYSASVVCWKSIDGGKTWTGWRGAPGGDDYQNVWINPNNPEIIELGSDQGALITVNGGRTLSSWYNQSTAQLYHVSADNSFPYRLYSGQQESGSVGIASRGDDGAITFRDWHPVGAEEYGYVTADPLDPEIIYGGKLTRYDRRNDQAQGILPLATRSPDFRMLRSEPVIFSPLDPHLLFFAGNTLWQTRDGGRHWEQISPDLTRKTYELPASIGKYREQPTAEAKQRGVIYTVAPSPLELKRIWAGTDDGLIQLTTDGGKHWTDVTPPQLKPWEKISLIDAGHFDARTAYAAVNTIRVDDLRPHIYRTNDNGKTWQEIVTGIPDGQTVNAVREDPQRRGLLFAGTERAVYYSLDEGAHWQSLRLNMPATSVRDLIIKDDDLAVATHGRGFWILDNITPLRQLAGDRQETGLFKPQTALRVRWSMNTDTPLPPDEPAGENPPEGAMIDYSLAEKSADAVTLEIKDAQGSLVRRYASTDALPPPDPKEVKVPLYWLRPLQPLSTERGLHRFFWDLHYAAIPNVEPSYPMTAVYRNTPPQATSPWVLPGQYSAVLTVDGKSYTQPLTVKMDPRVKTSAADLAQQFELSKKLYQTRITLDPIGQNFDSLVSAIQKADEAADGKPIVEKLAAFRQKLQSFTLPNARPGSPSRLGVLEKVEGLFENLQETDAPPTDRVKIAVGEVEKEAAAAGARWRGLLASDLPDLNRELENAGLDQLTLPH